MTELTAKTNTESNIPLYLQLKHHLLEKINHGEWTEGERLPTEFELKREYGFSRTTIRQALDEIEREGLVERRRGVGTIVCHKRIKPELMKLTSFSEDMQARGLTPGSQTIEVNFIVPPGKVSSELGIPPAEKVWCVKRLRLGDNQPIAVHDLYIPPDLLLSPRDLYEMQSYYTLIKEQLNLKISHASETLTAVAANKSEAALLHVTEGTPLLLIWRTTYSANDRVIEVVRLVYRADRYEYHAQLYV